MFTIKFYSGDGCRQIILEAESFTILRCPPGHDDGVAEITLHQKGAIEDRRIDVGDDSHNGPKRPDGWPPLFAKAIIENSAGKTTEIIFAGVMARPSQRPRDVSVIESINAALADIREKPSQPPRDGKAA